MIIVRHSSDPVHDRISHFLRCLSLLFLLDPWVCANSPTAVKHLLKQQEVIWAPSWCCVVEVRISSNRPMGCRGSARPVCITSGTMTSLCSNTNQKSKNKYKRNGLQKVDIWVRLEQWFPTFFVCTLLLHSYQISSSTPPSYPTITSQMC